jgi:hypothetical protein
MRIFLNAALMVVERLLQLGAQMGHKLASRVPDTPKAVNGF